MILVERRLGNVSLLGELQSLAESAGYCVVETLEQVRAPDSRYQIGKGKLEELARLVRETNAQRVIFENELKPVQAYNIAKATGVEVIDKFQLILEVFSRNASTREAKLQIELARLRYELTQAKEKVRLAKKGEQPGFHGLGRYEVDVYFEAIKRRVASIEAQLLRLRRMKQVKRTLRSDLGLQTISLAGYTVAGKSTLFKALTSVPAKVDRGPFTTLSPKTSTIDFHGKKALLTDTVGFIDRIPITLIEAFKSTLDETVFSDLIVLVVDVSENISEIERKLRCCLKTLREIGVCTTPIITAFNKVDLVDSTTLDKTLEELKGLAPNPVPISALYSINLEKLKRMIFEKLKGFVKASFRLPLNSSSLSLISKIHTLSSVVSQLYGEKSVTITVESAGLVIDKIKNHIENAGGQVLETQQV
ncbi:MAG: GTPase HflX [Candidatus Bathyarchaeia archaeon]